MMGVMGQLERSVSCGTMTRCSTTYGSFDAQSIRDSLGVGGGGVLTRQNWVQRSVLGRKEVCPLRRTFENFRLGLTNLLGNGSGDI